MHRMGKQKAKVGEFDAFVDSIHAVAPLLDGLWTYRITEVLAVDADAVAEAVWEVLARLKVSTSGTRIVAGSKALHHVLPDLVPPIDRQYTFRFFTDQMYVSHGERQAFLEWFPLLCEVGRARRVEIDESSPVEASWPRAQRRRSTTRSWDSCRRSPSLARGSAAGAEVVGAGWDQSGISMLFGRH